MAKRATSTANLATAFMATAASASTTLSTVDEYLSAVESPGLDSGGRNDTSDDSGYCVVVQRDNPLLTPLLGHARCRMLDKFTKRSLKDNVQSSLSATMRVMIESVMEKCEYLLGLASQADETIAFTADQQKIYNMLSNATPPRILAMAKKSKITKHMVEVWNILHILLPLVKLGRAEEHNLQSYFQLPDMINKSCCRELAEVDNEDRNAKAIKILPQERERNFKESRGFGVDLHRFPGCAKCGHTFIDKPHSNKAKVKQNSELQAKWKNNQEAVDNS
jgi:hypothetical protein